MNTKFEGKVGDCLVYKFRVRFVEPASFPLHLFVKKEHHLVIAAQKFTILYGFCELFRFDRALFVEFDRFFQKIVAQVPEAELYRYSTSLRSMTQGRGLHRATFSHYEPMPRHLLAQ